jgi:uncharacterized protein DUF3800
LLSQKVPGKGNRFSAEDVWFLMHHSDDPNRISSAVTCYCDDSGSHEEAAIAVVGGTLMNKPSFIDFDLNWRDILREFRIDGVHMKDFVRPYGKHVTMKREMKIALFTSAVKAILTHCIYTFSVSVPQTDYKSLLSKRIYREVMGAYTMAFFATIIMNTVIANETGYRNRIAYLVDKGSDHHYEQMNAAHTVVLEWEKYKAIESRVGPLAADLDDNMTALQAADVIAWSYHRKKESTLEDEFLPLLDIFNDRDMKAGGPKFPHLPFDIPIEGIKLFTDGVNAWIAKNGDMPGSLVELALSAPRQGR